VKSEKSTWGYFLLVLYMGVRDVVMIACCDFELLMEKSLVVSYSIY